MQQTARNMLHPSSRAEAKASRLTLPITLTRHDALLAIGLFAFSLMLNLIGISWSLPSAERSQYYPADISYYQSDKLEEGRLYLTAPYETYNPDEVYVLDALTNMSPGELDFNPRFFNYGSMMIYATGAAVKAADIAGLVTLANSKEYYLDNPDQMGQIFLIGRVLVAVLSAAGVAGMYFLVRVLYERSSVAILSAFILATMPVWLRNSHFLLVNIPSAAWMVLCAAFAAWAIRSQRSRPILISAFLAGLATSTKYTSGAIFILPLFALAKIILDKRYAPSERHPLLLGRGKLGKPLVVLVTGIAFFLGFIIATPYALITPNEFLNDVLYEGGTKLGVPSLKLLATEMIWAEGTVLFVLTLIGFAIAVRFVRTWQSQFLLLFALAGMAQRLISDVDFVRYLIPALPIFAIFAALAVDAIRAQVAARTTPLVGWGLAALLLLPSVGYSAETLTTLTGNDVRTVLAGWISETVPPESEIGYWFQIWFDNTPMHVDDYTLTEISTLTPETYPPIVILPSLSRGYWNVAPPPSDYELLTFEQRPLSLWTWPNTVSAEPLDWPYTFLDIQFYYHPERSGLGVLDVPAAAFSAE